MKHIRTKAEDSSSIIFTVGLLLVVAVAMLLFTQSVVYAQTDTSVRGEAEAEADRDSREKEEEAIREYEHAVREGLPVRDIQRPDARENEEAVICTADAFQCPNGSWVGRSGPNCEFVCADGSVHRKQEVEVVEYRDGDANRNETPGMRVAPSQTRVIVTPAIESSEDTDGDGVPTAPGRLDGIDVHFRDLDSDGDGISDLDELSTVSVNGRAVRGWNPETKDAVRARLAAATDRNDANDFGLRVAMHAIDNEEITDIRVGESTASIIFETRLRFLGLIPVTVTAETVAHSNGEVRTSYPWWSFLATKSQSERISVLRDIAVRLAAQVGVE